METLHNRWKELAKNISEIFNLRICGIDLDCVDIKNPKSDYSVIEVNATPGSRQFMASGVGDQARLKNIFMQFFRAT